MKKERNEKKEESVDASSLSPQSQARVDAAKDRLNFHKKVAERDDFVDLLYEKLQG